MEKMRREYEGKPEGVFYAEVTSADEEEVADIMAAIEAIEGVQKPTVRKFARELKKLRAK